MKNILYIFGVLLILLNGCTPQIPTIPLRKNNTVHTIQDIQVFSAPNADGAITPKTIEDAFESVGLGVAGNNDMNKPFIKRFGTTHYKIYNLAMFANDDLTFKLVKKYPQFGALTPLTMSIWSQGDSINIATLSIHGMSRAVDIPELDKDLQTYATLIQKALKKALPNGKFQQLHFHRTDKALQTTFTMDVDLEDKSIDEYIEDFEAEFEGELEPLGFLLPNYTNLQEEIFDDRNYHEYDFFHTYSICKFDVIFPVSKLHPEAGAWAPCSFYLYKKKDEQTMYMGFLSVENWITSLDIKDEESIKPLREAQQMIENILKEMTN